MLGPRLAGLLPIPVPGSTRNAIKGGIRSSVDTLPLPPKNLGGVVGVEVCGLGAPCAGGAGGGGVGGCAARLRALISMPRVGTRCFVRSKHEAQL